MSSGKNVKTGGLQAAGFSHIHVAFSKKLSARGNLRIRYLCIYWI